MNKRKNTYEVIFVGGEKDGKTLGIFATKNGAVEFAKEYEKEHEKEFDRTWGGVGIIDDAGNTVEW